MIPNFTRKEIIRAAENAIFSHKLGKVLSQTEAMIYLGILKLSMLLFQVITQNYLPEEKTNFHLKKDEIDNRKPIESWKKVNKETIVSQPYI